MGTSDWSSLPQDLLVSIAKLAILASVEDFMAFRSTCTSWYLAGRNDECLKRVKPRVPFLMVPEKAEFYSLSKKKSRKMMIPFPRGRDKQFTGIGFGWVLTLEKSGESYLLCPFSGARIRVPSYEAILPEWGRHKIWSPKNPYFRRTELSANPSETSDYVLVVLLMDFMAFWRPDDRNWTRIKSSNTCLFSDLVFSSKDRMFYAISHYDAKIWSWDMESDSAVLRMVSPCPPINLTSYQQFRGYLVESSTAELLLVRQRMGTGGFQVHRLDTVKGKTEILTRFEDAIFIGNNNACFCVRPYNDDDPVIKSDCIYFIKPEVNTIGIYNIADGNTEKLPVDFSNQPLWVTPSSLSFMAMLCSGSKKRELEQKTVSRASKAPKVDEQSAIWRPLSGAPKEGTPLLHLSYFFQNYIYNRRLCLDII